MKKMLRILAIAGMLAAAPSIAFAGRWSPGPSQHAPGPMRGAALECRGDRHEESRYERRSHRRHHRHYRHYRHYRHHGHERCHRDFHNRW